MSEANVGDIQVNLEAASSHVMDAIQDLGVVRGQLENLDARFQAMGLNIGTIGEVVARASQLQEQLSADRHTINELQTIVSGFPQEEV